MVVAARDEYEGVQLVIRSDAPISVRPVVSDLTGPATIPAAEVELFRVGYVQAATSPPPAWTRWRATAATPTRCGP